MYNYFIKTFFYCFLNYLWVGGLFLTIFIYLNNYALFWNSFIENNNNMLLKLFNISKNFDY